MNAEYLYIPNFITTDSITHLYHIFYDSTLREIESEYMLKSLEQLIPKLISVTVADLYSSTYACEKYLF